MLRDLTEDTLEVEARITDALIEMGSWEDVYVELYKRGVTGQVGHYCKCPVANWIASRVHEEVGVSGVDVEGYLPTEITQRVSLPENVTNFIREFDREKYPELVSTEDN